MANKKKSKGTSPNVRVQVVTTQPKKARARKRANRISGRGDYYGPFATLGAAGGRSLGGALDSYILGRGDYSVKRNSLMPSSSAVMQFQSTAHANRVQDSEFVMNVISSSTANSFNVQTVNLAADNFALLPKLSQIARNYTEFRVYGMVVAYVPLSADALTSTNTTLGRVILATQYNSYAPSFASTREMEAYEFAVAGKPSMPLLHPVECSPRENQVDLYSTAVTTNQKVNQFANNINYPEADLRLSQIGVLNVATDRVQGTSVLLGELRVYYDVELLKPRLWASLGNATQYWSAANSSYPISGSEPWKALTDYANVDVACSGEFVPVPNGAALKFQFPDGSDVTSGCFLISVYAGGATINAGTLSSTGGYLIAPQVGTGQTWNSFVISTGGAVAMGVYLAITGPGTLSWNSLSPTASMTVRYLITRIPNDFFRAQ